MNYIFPLAFLFNNFAVTALMIAMGLVGKSHLAADIGIVQGATMALFYSFSANARSMILNPQMRSLTRSFVLVRLLLIAPLGLASFYLSIFIADTGWILALAIILRRSVEWISEIHLSDMEFNDDRGSAVRFVAIQAILLLIASGCLLIDTRVATFGLFAWASLPLILSARFIREQFKSVGKFRMEWNQLLPHFGSTAIIGITVYVFRLLIVIFAGKAEAGDLYTAFAIGGSVGSVFAQALGPSISLHEERIGKAYFPRHIKIFLCLFFTIGTILFLAVYFNPDISAISGKSAFFWKALGLSMMGGGVMLYAQAIRFRLLQRFGKNDLFGPDVLMNILMLAGIPYLFNLAGKNALTTLYLMNAVFAYSFYFSAEKGHSTNNVLGLSKNYLSYLIVFLLFIPVFFQLSSGIFRDPSMTFSSDGLFSKLPIPLSVPACFAGIFLLGNYKRAYASLSFIFVIFILMLISSIISTQEYGFERQGKFILLTQFILPVFAFVLGQLYPTESISKLIFERILFYFLAVIIPAQLLFSWFQGSLLLSPYLYLFSIYQYLQYVPVIFVCVYLFTVYTLWETPKLKRILCVYASIMGVYAAASLSMLAIIALLSGLLGFVFYHCKHKFDKLTVVVLFLALFSSWGYLQFAKSHAAFVDKYEVIYDQMPTEQKTSKNTDDRMPTEQKALKNLTARFQYWRFYADNIISRLDTFFLGHGRPPDRYRYPSAHNYYLDLTYNFGFLALLPLLVIIGFTLKLIVQFRRDIFSSSSLVGLTFVVLFLLFFDNSLKVGLRQPYPGIITFFLWGILLSRLLAFRQRVKPNSAPT